MNAPNGLIDVPSEQALTFNLRGETLLGILHRPRRPFATGLLIVVGGPQYRAGSHRQFVNLSRAAAAQGVAVFRFDVRGMGDSTGAARSFEQLEEDIDAAIGVFVQACPDVRHVLLWGLCDGASAALLYLHQRQDPRVTGLVLVNPWVRTSETLALTTIKHYYLRRLREREFWRKLLSARVAGKAWRGLLANLQAARAVPQSGSEDDYVLRMRTAWSRFAGPILLVLSGNDYTAKEFLERSKRDQAWARNLARGNVTRLDLAEADHTFSDPVTARAVESATLGMLLAHQPHESSVGLQFQEVKPC